MKTTVKNVIILGKGVIYMEKPETKKTLYVIVTNHFDPMHRRCFDREFMFKGDTYIPYADLHEYYILDNLEFAGKHEDYKFVVESVIVARKFLERHPEKRDELRRLSREGRFYISGSGDNIIDSNMVLGESIVRNFLTGLLWVEDEFNQKTNLAIRNDAFGNSAQLPQILRGCEFKWVTGMSYTFPHGLYWKGLDGSNVMISNIPEVGRGGDYKVYPPCPACRGTKKNNGEDCIYCCGRGIDRKKGDAHWVFTEIEDKLLEEFGCGIVSMGGEEILPNPEVFKWVERMKEKYDVHFALPEVGMPYLKHLLDNVDDADEKDFYQGVELNPNNSGCWVTRIKTKQNCRRQEYALLTAEALCCMSKISGSQYPAARILKTWEKLLFTMFHDAITGTHVDPAHEEVKDTWAEIDELTETICKHALSSLLEKEDKAVSVINASGNAITDIARINIQGNAANIELTTADGEKAKILNLHQKSNGEVEAEIMIENIQPFSSKTFYVSDSGLNVFDTKELDVPIIENQRFLITADEHGLLSVYDKKLCSEILRSDEYRPGEFILEHDEGSPWATLSRDMKRTPLSKHTRLVGKRKGPGYQLLEFEIPPIHSYAEDAVSIRYYVTLYEGIERIDFHADINWDDYNHRLRVAMPVPFEGRYIYEIPYGMLERESYVPSFDSEGLCSRWSNSNGDWPAINWAGVQGKNFSVALFNKGTPSYRMEKSKTRGEVILLTVLRSPCVPTYLHEPIAYSMTDWDGIRDAGIHKFEYAVVAYGSSFSDSSVVIDAENYNRGLYSVSGRAVLPEMPMVKSDNVRLACIKLAEKGNALIMRLCEYRGKPGEVVVELPDYVSQVAKVNLLERQGELLKIEAKKVRLNMRKFEIATLRLELI